MTRMLSILLVDDHALVRDMLRVRFDAEEDMQVVGVAGDADDAVTKALECKPDIVLMDIDMPGLLCFDAARIITRESPSSRIVFLSAFAHDDYIEQALAVNAVGYVTKNEPPEVLLRAVRNVGSGLHYYSPDVQARLVVDRGGARLLREARMRASTLTRREMEVLQYIARGLSKKEIARIMHLGVKTIEHHSTSIMHKLDIHDRVALARYAIREGLIEP